MTKNEFIEEIRNRLKYMPKEELESRINFFEESIIDRMDEGKSEEEAVSELGNIDDIISQIVGETSLISLVKEKARPKRNLKGFEIALIVLGFPIWLPLLSVILALCLLAYVIVWVLVIVSFSIEAGFVGLALMGLVYFIINLSSGNMSLTYLGAFLTGTGGSMLFIFVCKKALKLTLKLSKAIIMKIKMAFISKGE